MNTLILVPGKNARGGITNYYSSIRKHLPTHIVYFTRGSRKWPQKANRIIELTRIMSDYFKFIFIILFKNISLVQTTTAFNVYTLTRDSIFILISKLFKKKVIVFFRGWNDDFAYNLSGITLRIFKSIYFNVDGIIDLSRTNTDYLKKIGYKGKLFLETTIVDVDLVSDININELIRKRISNKEKTILFLSRIEVAKGIYKLLDIFSTIKKNKPEYKLIFAGDGSELENLKIEISRLKIKDVTLKGFVTGKEKKQLFETASIFLFLSDSEGMPNAVLEAMSFGLPVITTNVGGISSVFKNDRNGILINKYDINEVVVNINNIISNKILYYSYSLSNYNDAKKKVWSNIAAIRMLKIFDEVLNQN